MRLLLDVHVSSRNLGRPLRERGHDVHALDTDDRRKELSDEEVLAFAAAGERIVITHNVKDFAFELRRRHEAGEHHAGCVLVTLPHTAYGEILRRLDQLAGSLPRPEDWCDRAVWISRPDGHRHVAGGGRDLLRCHAPEADVVELGNLSGEQ